MSNFNENGNKCVRAFQNLPWKKDLAEQKATWPYEK